MTKKEVLNQLRTAKTAHIQWRSYAQALISGLPVEQDQVPVVHTRCKFGQWYYGDGQNLAALPGYAAIEAPHEILHQVYMKIFKVLFAEDDRSAFSKLFGSKSKLNRKRQEEADALMQNLLSVSRTLLEAIAMLEQEIQGMPEEELTALFA